MSEAIAYKIYLDKLTKHLLSVECTIQRPNEGGQIVSLPAWVPGSYLIRDFAKHVVAIEAYANGVPVTLRKIEKNTWKCTPCTGPLVIRYDLYCFDLTARGAYVDHTRVFFDGCRIFLVVEGEEEQTRSVEIVRPDAEYTQAWRCATSMTPDKIDRDGFGVYIANNHLELIDHPFEISDFKRFEFVVANVPHYLIVSGKAQGDFDRLVADVEKVCQTQVNFFGELPPLRSYVFILSVLGKGWGGIEHRASCSLVCTRSSLPKFGDQQKSEEYRNLLGLFSHEYFHLWNVKRIKPEVFTNPNLRAEVYTRQLWIFEGITSYFDNLNLVASQIFSVEEYLQLLQSDISTYLQNPGSFNQTLSDSSFDAWIKFYQPDENSVNSGVSYYLKGSLVALALDLLIIKNSKRKQSLADIMQVLWQQYGKTGLGLPEDYFQRITYEVTGEDYSEFFTQALDSVESLELEELFHEVGIGYNKKNLSIIDNLGLKLNSDQNKLTVRAVLSDSVAEQAGIAVNDVLVAINNFAVNNANFESIVSGFPVHETLLLHVIRNDILLELQMLNPPIMSLACELNLLPHPSERHALNRQKWLGI
jgi:predicted metalloprotease with PDZ domain